MKKQMTLTNLCGDLLAARLIEEKYLLAEYRNPLVCDEDRGPNGTYYLGTRVVHCTHCGCQWEEEEYSCGRIYRGGTPCGC